MENSTTPDTLAYLYLGLTVVIVLAGGYVSSLLLRYRNLTKDETLIEQLIQEES